MIFFGDQLDPKRAATKLNYEALRAHTETGHHNVSEWDVKKTQELRTMPVLVPQVTGVAYHSNHHVLDGVAIPTSSLLHSGLTEQ